MEPFRQSRLTHALRHQHRPVPNGAAHCCASANDPDAFKQWLYGGIQDLGKPAVIELLLDWLDPFITRVERDRIVAWCLGVSLQLKS